MTRILLIALPLLALTACSDEPAKTSTTKLDAVEVQPGTISDSMIILDNAANEGTAIDNSVPDDGAKKSAEKDDAQTTEESAPENESANDNAESGEASPATKTAPSAAAKTSGE